MDGWRQVLKLRATVFRYREPVVAKDDEVKYREKDVTFQRIDEEGKLVDTKWKIPEKEYELIPADPKETADRWSYLDPETGHQPSTWATGLTLSVSSISRTSWDARWFNDLISTRKPPAYSRLKATKILEPSHYLRFCLHFYLLRSSRLLHLARCYHVIYGTWTTSDRP